MYLIFLYHITNTLTLDTIEFTKYMRTAIVVPAVGIYTNIYNF